MGMQVSGGRGSETSWGRSPLLHVAASPGHHRAEGTWSLISAPHRYCWVTLAARLL